VEAAERKSTTNGDDARPAGLLHEPHELSTSTLMGFSSVGTSGTARAAAAGE
jgi:hypothetical protein